jgi:putative tricarboxylic transport membrane protein
VFRDPAGPVVAALLLAAAALIAWDTSNIPVTSVYGLGPEAMPTVVAGGLALLAVGNLVMALRGEMPAREPIDLKAILLILSGLVALMLVIGLNGGFIPATALLFAATSAAFGRRAFLTDLVIGLVLAVLVYLMFVKVLSLSLPTGPLERLL